MSEPHISLPYIPIPIRELESACKFWLGGIAWPTAFKLERDGLLQITRIDGEFFIAADDAQRCIDACRGETHRPAADIANPASTTA
jgi:hypothetical protein